MKRILLPLLLVVLLLTACSPIQTVTPLPLTPPPVTDGTPLAPTEPGGTAPVPTIHTVSAPAGSEPIWLRILAPIDQQVVNLPQVEVTGEAAAGAVVTINEQILIVGPDEKFTATVPLTEGPNLIEIVASDALGGEMTLELVVIYEP